ncbi:glycosyltransferase [Sporomusa acidovorans]|uniref:Glycosyltransferase 2-like domain-containing protein n=1 Tax=Sporomusa acidovorans (strain ATCC 49682 / DSM 3132 / Mol) TaxID=1123286 RepID=A0ABZ3JAF5_SPOA4|nr:TPR domain-containing glycosyltransferase [Sporomusa acidovorans]OZC15159.1 SPBc2 prophage-derived glycosyltransferase SunS [Sporomusa acidovorans DSM 3132]SDF43622.1 Tetratricopeptide repeat-containing protein [Sporomusa acidovorans]
MTGLLSIAMIVKDEEAVLRACLDSVEEIADEIVIVDTGSADKTVEIAKNYTDKVYSYLWQDDFSAARNFAIDQCCCEWILFLDADERLAAARESLRELITNTTKEAFMLPMKNYTGPVCSAYNVIGVLRLFRNLPHYRYIGKIHEQVGIANHEVVGYSDFPVISHSYSGPCQRQDKRRRNIKILSEQLKCEPENEAFIKYYLGCEWLGLGQYQQAYACFQFAYEQFDNSHVFFRSSTVRSLIACLRFMGNFREALAICMKETAVYPEYTDLFFDGGVVLEQLEEYEIAARWFKEAAQTGTPPMIYQHTHGTENFLSQYHLGHCCQILGKCEEAAQWYEKALTANKNFIYPLYGLFMVLVTKKSCEELINYFTERGYVTGDEGLQALGELLFASGRPDLAVKVCSQPEKNVMPSSQLIKYYLYSGNFEQALAMIEELQTMPGMNDTATMQAEILCSLFLTDLDAAKEKCLNMWQAESLRAEAIALLALTRRLGGHRLVVSEQYQPVLIESLLKIIADCARSYGGNSSVFIKIAKCCEEILSDFEQGSKALLAYWQSEIKGVEMLLDLRYKCVRGLYVWKKAGR